MSGATCPVQGPSGLPRYPYPASKHVVVTSSPCAGFWCHGHTLDLICGFGEDRRWSFKRAVRRKQNDRWQRSSVDLVPLRISRFAPWSMEWQSCPGTGRPCDIRRCERRVCRGGGACRCCPRVAHRSRRCAAPAVSQRARYVTTVRRLARVNSAAGAKRSARCSSSSHRKTIPPRFALRCGVGWGLPDESVIGLRI